MFVNTPPPPLRLTGCGGGLGIALEGVSDGDGTRSIVAGVGNMQAVPPVAAEAAADAAARAAVPADAGPADAPPPDAPMADASASVLD